MPKKTLNRIEIEAIAKEIGKFITTSASILEDQCGLTIKSIDINRKVDGETTKLTIKNVDVFLGNI